MKSNQLTEIFDYFVQEEYSTMFQFISDNQEMLSQDQSPFSGLTHPQKTSAKANLSKKIHLHMCLTSEQGNQTLEFYRDAYLTQPLDLRIPVNTSDFINLGIDI